MSSRLQKPSAKRVVATSLAVKALDLTINYTVSVLTGSVTIFAEALQGGSDLVSTILLMVGLSRSRKPRDRVHQFGHGSELYFWALVASVVILFGSGIPSIYFGLNRIMNPQVVKNAIFAYGVLSIAVVTNLYSFRLSAKRLLDGKKVSRLPRIFMSDPRVETKTTFTIDLMQAMAAATSLVALIAYAFTQDSFFDGVGAVGVGVILVIFAIFLMIGIVNLLIGRSAPPETEQKIRAAVRSFSEVKKILDMKTMYVGPDTILVSLELYLKRALTAANVEALVGKIQDSIEKEVPQAHFVQIEVETPKIGKKARMMEKPAEDY